MIWRLSWRSDPRAVALFDRHYSRGTVGAPNVAGPGRPLVLLTDDSRALWVSLLQRPEAQKHRWPGAWACTVFRNEGAGLSSELIHDAVAATRAAWGDPPPLGLLTFVDAQKTSDRRARTSMPGECFLRAGFIADGMTAGGHGRAQLHALRLPPLAWPAAEPARGTTASLLGAA